MAKAGRTVLLCTAWAALRTGGRGRERAVDSGCGGGGGGGSGSGGGGGRKEVPAVAFYYRAACSVKRPSLMMWSKRSPPLARSSTL